MQFSISKETYFIKNERTNKPKGKLYDRYYTRKRTLRNLNFTADANQEKEEDQEKQNPPEKYDEEKLESIRVELKYIREWKLVLEKWQESLPLRLADIKSKPINEVRQRWPLFKYTRAPDLVNIFCLHAIIQ